MSNRILIGNTYRCSFPNLGLLNVPLIIKSAASQYECYTCQRPDGGLVAVHEYYLKEEINTLSKEERLLARHRTTWNQSKYVLAHPNQAY